MEVYLPGVDKTVQVRGLKVKEIDSIADKRQMVSGEAIEKMINDCLQSEEVKATDLLAGDRNAIFLGVRRATYGDLYDFQLKCPHCDNTATYTIDLSQIPVIKGDRELIDKRLRDKEFLAPFTFPSCKKTVHWRFKDAQDMKKSIEIAKKKGDSTISQGLLLLVKKVEDLEGMSIKNFLENLDAGDAQAFAEFYKEKEPGLEDEIQVFCENGMCGAEMKVTMPFDAANFFKRSVRTKRSSTVCFTSLPTQE